VLVLDDATSAVDATVESRIHAGLRATLPGRTAVVIAHRRSTLHLADRIVVLDHGRVVADGTHEDLMAHSALYRELLPGLERDDDAAVSDRIEVLAERAVPLAGPATSVASAPEVARPVRVVGAPSLGAGLGGGGGRGAGGSWRLNLAPSPELLAQVAALAPIRDHITVDPVVEPVSQRPFSLGGLLGEFRGPLLVGLVLVVLDALASLAGPVLVKVGINRGVTAGSQRALFVASALYLLVAAADLVDQVAETFVVGKTAQRIMLHLRVRIWAQLQRLSLDYYEREMAGRIMTRMTTDVDQFESLIQNGLLSALVSGVSFVGVGVALVLLNPVLGGWTLSVVIPLSLATVAFRRGAVRLYDTARDRIAVVNADFQESLSGIRECQAYVHQEATIERFHQLGERYLAARVGAQRLVSVYFPFVQFLSGVADAIVLGVGSALIVHGQLSRGALIAFLLYIDVFFAPIQQLSQVFDAWQQTRVSVGRIGELMALSSATPEAPGAVDPGTCRGRLELRQVGFAYPARPEHLAGGAPSRGSRAGLLEAQAWTPSVPEVLHGINLTIEAGQTVALVGETGAGKSTVIKLLARFYDPDHGQVLIDGHDLRDLTVTGWRRQIGYVPQEAFLFSGTVRDNIAYGRPDADDAAVEAAARAVGAHDFVATLPDRYQHWIGERGRSLSAGQRQLLALARAQMVDPVVLLLDEATSNLDLVSEANVAGAMGKVARGRTTVIIAHRLQTARLADRIVVMHAGSIIEQGTHDELVARSGHYSAMWDTFVALQGPPPG
jgi:ATP-binding cassette subfamily B protein